MRRPEEALHRSVVAYLRATLPEPWLVVHVPNGGGRSKAEAGILKAMGVLAGMPDLLVIGPLDRLGRISIWPTVIAIELKAPPKMLKTGKPSQAKPAVSDAQRDVIAALGACGIPTLIVRDLDEAIRALRELGVPLKGRAP
jgi:hypothetical protein